MHNEALTKSEKSSSNSSKSVGVSVADCGFNKLFQMMISTSSKSPEFTVTEVALVVSYASLNCLSNGMIRGRSLSMRGGAKVFSPPSKRGKETTASFLSWTYGSAVFPNAGTLRGRCVESSCSSIDRKL